MAGSESFPNLYFYTHACKQLFIGFFCSLSFFSTAVGCTMDDIRYKFDKGLNSVQVSSDVSLPEFKVLGHRQKTIEASLSSGDRSMTTTMMRLKKGSNRRLSYFLSNFIVHRNAFRTWNCFFTSKRGEKYSAHDFSPKCHAGNYSRLAVEVQFVRASGHTLARLFVPCAMVVCLSWVAFWLDRRATTSRVGLGMLAIIMLLIVRQEEKG